MATKMEVEHDIGAWVFLALAFVMFFAFSEGIIEDEVGGEWVVVTASGEITVSADRTEIHENGLLVFYLMKDNIRAAYSDWESVTRVSVKMEE